MIPPGWNVTEPIGLAIKLYRIAEDLRNAPEETRIFRQRLMSFNNGLETLQEILEEGAHSARLIKHVDRLKKVVEESQGCVKRCEDFVSKTRQAARWVWKKDEASRLTAEIDSRLHDLSFGMQLVTLRSSFHDTKGADPIPIIGHSGHNRADTIASLPPYTSPQLLPNDAHENLKPLIPGGLLGISLEKVTAPAGLQPRDAPPKTPIQSSSPNSVISPSLGPAVGTSPSSPPNAELDTGGLKPLGSRRNTQVQVVASSNSSVGSSSMYSRSPFTPVMTSRSSMISPDLPPLEDGLRQRQDSLLFLDEITPEDSMQSVRGATITFTRGKIRLTRPIDKIEVFRRAQAKRYIVLYTPNIKHYLKCPPSRPLMPHVEHPIAHGSETTHQVEFLDGIECWSEKAPSNRTSDTQMSGHDFSTAASSAASIRSSSSMASGGSGNPFRKESDQQEYDFDEYNDCKRFQEMIIGQGVELQAQLPVDDISIKTSRGKSIKESEFQCIRLWRSGSHQYLTYYANNACPSAYREYRMTHLRKGKSKSKTVILNVEVPGSPNPKGSTSAWGLTKAVDVDEMRALQQISIAFTKSTDQAIFLQKARFNGIFDDPVLPPFAFETGRPGG